MVHKHSVGSLGSNNTAAVGFAFALCVCVCVCVCVCACARYINLFTYAVDKPMGLRMYV